MPKVIKSSYFPVHAHSEYSWLDGLGSVQQMVEKVAKLGQPALALTDHGNTAGVIKLYKYCKTNGLAPFPGEEFYLVRDVNDDETKGQRWHLGIIALDYEGYKALLQLSSRSHRPDRFYYRPLIDFGDLAELSRSAKKHVAITTGCRSGPVVDTLLNTQSSKAAAAMVAKLARWFPHTFVELQYHGIGSIGDRDSDMNICQELLAIADDLGLPVVFGQDSHYCEPEHQEAHDLMKDICYFGDSETDNHFSGGPYDLAPVSELRQLVPVGVWDRIEEGHEALLDLNTLKIPALDKFVFHVPNMGSEALFKRKVQLGMEDKGFDVWEAYDRRIKYELGVINKKGFGSYFLLIQRILGWARQHGIFYNVRGSANGSLVCYVLGITNVDPVQWNLSFDRFLSMDRSKPPDIDVDVESDRRAEVIGYIKTIFPTAVPIGTFGRIGITKDPNASPEDDPKGSLIVQYMAAGRKKLGDKFDGKVHPDDWDALELLSSLPARKAAGVHAAGWVLPADDHPIEDNLSTMYISSSETTCTQQVMEDVEDAGFVKCDLLGLRSLKTLRLCIEAIGKDPVKDRMEWIPNDDPAACRILRSGVVDNGVFQFEGYSTAKGAKELGVQNTFDAILALALFRPAMMDSGMTDLYIKARRTKTFQTIHPQIDPIMKDTWGVPVFQEQVISIMRAVGLEADDLNAVLKAVKASNDKITEYAIATFDRVHPIFVRKACSNLDDCDRPKAEEIWATVMKFSDYGFNQAHATGYGLVSYWMAWLKAHYSLVFHTALLSAWSGRPKEAKYIREARRMGITIAKADVNRSDVEWVKDGNAIRRGLLSIKDVGIAAATVIVEEREKNGPYESLEDLVARVPARPVSGGKNWTKTGTFNGVLRTLELAGALASLT